MTAARISRAKHGRRYTREGDDPVNRIPDTDPGIQGAVSALQILDDGLPGPSYYDLTFWDHMSVTDSETVALNP